MRSSTTVLAASLLSAAMFAPLARAATDVSACYDVPVKSDLKPFSHFPVTKASLDTAANGAITITYDLPKDIVGPAGVSIVLSGTLPAGEGSFFKVHETATDTTGECVESDVSLTCMLHYAGLVLDPTANATYLTQKYAGDADLPQRIQVMQNFAGNGIGILSVDLP
jgi:hypothetical protein